MRKTIISTHQLDAVANSVTKGRGLKYVAVIQLIPTALSALSKPIVHYLVLVESVKLALYVNLLVQLSLYVHRHKMQCVVRAR